MCLSHTFTRRIQGTGSYPQFQSPRRNWPFSSQSPRKPNRLRFASNDRGRRAQPSYSRSTSMFQELMPLLSQHVLILTLSRVTEEEVRVNIIPKPLKADSRNDDAVLTTPLSVTGTAQELDEQLPRQLTEFVEAHLGLSSTLRSAKEQMDAASKTAREAGSPREPRPAKRWRVYLENHRDALTAMDFFPLPTISISLLH